MNLKRGDNCVRGLSAQDSTPRRSMNKVDIIDGA